MTFAAGEPLPSARCLGEQAAGWLFLHDLFRRPSDSQWAWLSSTSAQEAWRLLSESLQAGGFSGFPLAASREDYEAGYISAFDVGLPTPPCPLLESHWNRVYPPSQVVHENLLFYQHFGFTLKEPEAEAADHLLRQLEFLAGLCLLQAETETAGVDTGAAAEIARARRDYLDRHILSWVPQAFRSLAEELPGSWQAAWLELLSAYVCAVE